MNANKIPYPQNYYAPFEPELKLYRVEFSNGYNLDVSAYDELEAREEAIFDVKGSGNVNLDCDFITEVLDLDEAYHV